MALFSFLKGRGDARASSTKAAPGAQPVGPGQVDEVRTRARRRLIGAAVLVSAAVVGLPLLFESKPRPIAVDTPISVARPDGLPAVSVPAARPVVPETPAASGPATAELPGAVPRESAGSAVRPQAGGSEAIETLPQTGREVALPVPPVVVARPDIPETPRPIPTKPDEAKSSVAKPRTERAEKPARSPEPAAKPRSAKDESARAEALLEGRESPPKATKAPAPATGSGKFVVQVGAFSQASSAEAAVAQVGKLGLKAYSQDVETSAGKRTRVRLGPFASREEADRAAQRLKAAGQSAAVVPQ